MSTPIKIYCGDADTLTETITGLDTLTGYTAKLYLKTLGGVAIDTITGTISGLTVIYEIVNENSKAYPIGRHNLETKLFDASDHVYTTSKREFVVMSVLTNDPT
jgi:hypothetical protein